MSTYSASDKLAEIEIEISYIKRTFPKRIAQGAMSLGQAARKLDILRAVASDYRRLADQGEHEKLTPSDASMVETTVMSSKLDTRS